MVKSKGQDIKYLQLQTELKKNVAFSFQKSVPTLK